MAGSVTGDDSQNAITGANGTPDASRPVINGNTVIPQTGVIAPIVEASKIDFHGVPSSACLMRPPAPLALTHADTIIPGTTSGTTSIIPLTTNIKVSKNRMGIKEPDGPQNSSNQSDKST
jgi:hypothetical protein